MREKHDENTDPCICAQMKAVVWASVNDVYCFRVEQDKKGKDNKQRQKKKAISKFRNLYITLESK